MYLPFGISHCERRHHFSLAENIYKRLSSVEQNAKCKMQCTIHTNTNTWIACFRHHISRSTPFFNFSKQIQINKYNRTFFRSSLFLAADEIDRAIIPVVATISSPAPTTQSIIDSVTQPWFPSQLHGNKYFTDSEQHKRTTLNHIDKTIGGALAVANSTNQNNDESLHVTSATESVATQTPQSITISSAMDSASERHKPKISTATPTTTNNHAGKKQLIISRVSTHSDTPALAPSPKLNKIFDTFSAANKHHHHDHR